MVSRGSARGLASPRWRTENLPLWLLTSLLCGIGLCQLSPADATDNGVEKSLPGNGRESLQYPERAEEWEKPLPTGLWPTVDDPLRVGNRRLLDVAKEDEEEESAALVQESSGGSIGRSGGKEELVSEESRGEGDEAGEVEVERSRANLSTGKRKRRKGRQIPVDDGDQEGLEMEREKKDLGRGEVNAEEGEDGASEFQEQRRRRRGVEEEVAEEGGRDALSGSRQRRRRWTDRVESFVTRKVTLKKETQKREVGSVRTEFLKSRIEGQKLRYVFLDYFKFETGSIPSGRPYSSLQCLGGTCPKFKPCEQEGYGEISACSRPELIDYNRSIPLPPGNCPLVQNRGGEGVARKAVFDPKCSHAKDYLRHESMANEVFELRNMFINERGHVFNATHYFDRNGCGMGGRVGGRQPLNLKP